MPAGRGEGAGLVEQRLMWMWSCKPPNQALPATLPLPCLSDCSRGTTTLSLVLPHHPLLTRAHGAAGAGRVEHGRRAGREHAGAHGAARARGHGHALLVLLLKLGAAHVAALQQARGAGGDAVSGS